MLRFVLVVMAVAMTGRDAVLPQTPAPGSIDQLAWLSGCWSMTRPDGVTEEQWMKPSGGTMIGMGRTVRGGKTTEYEFLQIREAGGKLAYVAKPSGQAEATFPIASMSADAVTFENPAHDFPQRIIYKRLSETSVTARIEGTVNGQARGVDFPYTRCQ